MYPFPENKVNFLSDPGSLAAAQIQFLFRAELHLLNGKYWTSPLKATNSSSRRSESLSE